MEKEIKLNVAEQAGLEFMIAKKSANPHWVGDENPFPMDLGDDGDRDEHEISPGVGGDTDEHFGGDPGFNSFLFLMFDSNRPLRKLIGNNFSLKQLKDIRKKSILKKS